MNDRCSKIARRPETEQRKERDSRTSVWHETTVTTSATAMKDWVDNTGNISR